MQNKYAKPKAKINPIAYIIAAIFVVIIVVAIVAFRPSASDKIQKAYNQEIAKVEGATQDMLLAKDHVLRKVSLKDLDNRIQGRNLVIVYEGGTWCQVCVKEVQVYSDEFKKNEQLKEYTKNLLYLEVPENGELKGKAEFVEKYNIKNASMVPSLRAFYNGKLVDVSYVYGTSGEDLRTRVRDFYIEVLAKIQK